MEYPRIVEKLKEVQKNLDAAKQNASATDKGNWMEVARAQGTIDALIDIISDEHLPF
jgi:hypothetical protein